MRAVVFIVTNLVSRPNKRKHTENISEKDDDYKIWKLRHGGEKYIMMSCITFTTHEPLV